MAGSDEKKVRRALREANQGGDPAAQTLVSASADVDVPEDHAFDAIDAFDHLLELGEDWNGPKTCGPSKRTWYRMRTMLRDVILKARPWQREVIGRFYISPGNDGSLAVEWRVDNMHFAIHVDRRSHLPFEYAAISHSSGFEATGEGDVSDVIDGLCVWLREFRDEDGSG